MSARGLREDGLARQGPQKTQTPSQRPGTLGVGCRLWPDPRLHGVPVPQEGWAEQLPPACPQPREGPTSPPPGPPVSCWTPRTGRGTPAAAPGVLGVQGVDTQGPWEGRQVSASSPVSPCLEGPEADLGSTRLPTCSVGSLNLRHRMLTELPPDTPIPRPWGTAPGPTRVVPAGGRRTRGRSTLGSGPRPCPWAALPLVCPGGRPRREPGGVGVGDSQAVQWGWGSLSQLATAGPSQHLPLEGPSGCRTPTREPGRELAPDPAGPRKHRPGDAAGSCGGPDRPGLALRPRSSCRILKLKSRTVQFPNIPSPAPSGPGARCRLRPWPPWPWEGSRPAPGLHPRMWPRKGPGGRWGLGHRTPPTAAAASWLLPHIPGGGRGR